MLKIVKPQRERKVKPAPPHEFRPVRIYTNEGLRIRCSPPGGREYAACQDDTHQTRCALMDR